MKTPTGSAMNMTSKVRLLISLTAVIILVGCASVPEPRGLGSGVWELETSDGATIDVQVSELEDWTYYFDAGTHPISGVYALESERVSMVKPDNPRMKAYVWRVKTLRWLILIEEPPVELTGEQLISSEMTGPLRN